MSNKIKLRSECLMLGGAAQWIHFNEPEAGRPLLLFLHGGPGIVETPLLTKYCHGLYEHFLVVHWDQKGAGKSYNPDDHSELSVHILVRDGIELVKILNRRFGRKKAILMGHSWGTALGILMCKSSPEIFHQYIGIGQVGNWMKGEFISYRYTYDTAAAKNEKWVMRLLKKIGEPPYKSLRDLMIQRYLLIRYGGGMYGEKSLFNMFPDYLLGDPFSLFQMPRQMAGSYHSASRLWEQCLAIDLNIQAPVLDVPICFLTGRYDHQIPFACSTEYYDTLEAPDKSWYWFEHSAHTPFIEESGKFNQVVLNEVLANRDCFD
jgi:pimeloyl-ACP methyl ester carboxylesterase